MNQNDWDVLRGAIGANLILLNNPGDFNLLGLNSPPTNVQELSFFMAGVTVEIEIGDALHFTFEALQGNTNALISAHRLAAAAVVPAPASADINQITGDLATISAAVQADERFHQVVQLSAVIANIAGQLG